ncbi:MAG: DUF2520 domain-containing protein [Peptococcaceae bacterium]|nr:DUF2520 domain-containing protein [Peptococcaceae bacterium]
MDVDVGIIGAGLVGSALALKLQRQPGYAVRMIANRSRDKAESLASRVGAVVGTNQAIAQTCELILITTPDRVIAAVAQEIAADCHAGQIVVHCSGSLKADILEPVRRNGALTVSVHPLQPFASVEIAAQALAGAYFTVEGEAQEWACQWVRELGGTARVIRADQKTLYHAAACVAANYLVVLAAIAADLLTYSGFEREEGLAALLPLMQGSLDNLAGAGLPQALTGPIPRGDADIVAAHLRAMPPEYLPLYRQLGVYAVELGVEKKTIGEEARRQLREILVEPEQ